MTGRVEAYTDESVNIPESAELEALVRNAAEAALAAEHKTGPDRVTVMLSGDSRLRALNLEFNGDDEVTDVLSFNDTPGWRDGVPPAEIAEGDERFRAPGEEPRLGDIVISVEQTRRQAEQNGVQFERELAMLTIHGVLHLLGYDHAEPAERDIMFGKTDRILDSLMSETD